MSFIDDIKRRAALSRIAKEAKSVQRTKTVFNIADAKTIGISFAFTSNEDFELMKKYVLYLREMKKKVKAIMYYSTKEEPNVQYSKVDYDFYNRKSHNWTGKPTDHLVTNFIEEEFDVLIDTGDNTTPVLAYIAAHSKAKFKIGRFSINNNVHDMQLESPAEKGLKFFLRQVDTYFGMINKPVEKSGG